MCDGRRHHTGPIVSELCLCVFRLIPLERYEDRPLAFCQHTLELLGQLPVVGTPHKELLQRLFHVRLFPSISTSRSSIISWSAPISAVVICPADSAFFAAFCTSTS